MKGPVKQGYVLPSYPSITSSRDYLSMEDTGWAQRKEIEEINRSSQVFFFPGSRTS